MLRGTTWDRLTLGRARRKRAMMRRLRELDRLDGRDRALAGTHVSPSAVLPPPRPPRDRETARRLFVGVVTTVLVAGAVVVVLDRELGYDLSLDGFERRTPLGGPPVVHPGEGTFAFMQRQRGTDDPVTYDPCRPIDIVVNDAQAPAGGDRIVEEAVVAVSAATGLTLRVVGTTDEPARKGRPALDPTRYPGRWSPVLLAWTDRDQVPGLAGDVAGLGGSLAQVSDLSGLAQYVTGTVSLDAPQLARVLARMHGREQVRAIVMHELGHLVGLGHVDDPGELMADENNGLTDFGPGDLEGLAALGRGACS